MNSMADHNWIIGSVDAIQWVTDSTYNIQINYILK